MDQNLAIRPAPDLAAAGEPEPATGLDLTQPHTQAAYRYWAEKRGARRMPTPGDINPAEIRALLPHITVVEILEGSPVDYLYKIDGEAVRDAIGFTRTGHRLSEYRDRLGAAHIWLHDCYDKLRADRTPRSVRHALDYLSRSFHILEIVFLPLSRDGETVHRVLQCIDFVHRPEDM